MSWYHCILLTVRSICTCRYEHHPECSCSRISAVSHPDARVVSDEESRLPYGLLRQSNVYSTVESVQDRCKSNGMSQVKHIAKGFPPNINDLITHFELTSRVDHCVQTSSTPRCWRSSNRGYACTSACTANCATAIPLAALRNKCRCVNVQM